MPLPFSSTHRESNIQKETSPSPIRKYPNARTYKEYLGSALALAFSTPTKFCNLTTTDFLAHEDRSRAGCRCGECELVRRCTNLQTATVFRIGRLTSKR